MQRKCSMVYHFNTTKKWALLIVVKHSQPPSLSIAGIITPSPTCIYPALPCCTEVVRNNHPSRIKAQNRITVVIP